MKNDADSGLIVILRVGIELRPLIVRFAPERNSRIPRPVNSSACLQGKPILASVRELWIHMDAANQHVYPRRPPVRRAVPLDSSASSEHRKFCHFAAKHISSKRGDDTSLQCKPVIDGVCQRCVNTTKVRGERGGLEMHILVAGS